MSEKARSVTVGRVLLLFLVVAAVILFFGSRRFLSPDVCASMTREEAVKLTVSFDALKPRLEVEETIKEDVEGYGEATIMVLSAMNTRCTPLRADVPEPRAIVSLATTDENYMIALPFLAALAFCISGRCSNQDSVVMYAF